MKTTKAYLQAALDVLKNENARLERELTETEIGLKHAHACLQAQDARHERVRADIDTLVARELREQTDTLDALRKSRDFWYGRACGHL